MSGISTGNGLADSWMLYPVFWIAHAALGPAMRVVPGLVVFHALATVAVGAYWAFFTRRRDQVVYWCAYIAGAEVLWRMNRTPLFWEMAKYAIAILALGALLHIRPQARSLSALLYLALLVPSVLITWTVMDYEEFREAVSFSLSGPLCLAASIAFLSTVRFRETNLWRMAFAFVNPIISIAVITISTSYSSDIVFSSRGSNRMASGGFGPNQVSGILGLGLLLLLLALMSARMTPVRKVLTGGLALLFMAQSAMTFSRGGLYGAFGALVPALYFLGGEARMRARVLTALALIGILAVVVVVPMLNQFTGGALRERFGDTESTGRTTLMMQDIRVWLEHPLLGVGVGLSPLYHYQTDSLGVAAHTEFTRLLAEHGVPGLAANLMLLMIGLRNFRSAKTKLGKALTTSAIAWSLLSMVTAAMRTAAPGFVFGLSCLTLLAEERRDGASKRVWLR